MKNNDSNRARWKLVPHKWSQLLTMPYSIIYKLLQNCTCNLVKRNAEQNSDEEAINYYSYNTSKAHRNLNQNDISQNGFLKFIFTSYNIIGDKDLMLLLFKLQRVRTLF